MSALLDKLRAKARSITLTVLTTVAAIQVIPGIGPLLDLLLMAFGIGAVWLLFKLKL